MLLDPKRPGSGCIKILGIFSLYCSGFADFLLIYRDQQPLADVLGKHVLICCSSLLLIRKHFSTQSSDLLQQWTGVMRALATEAVTHYTSTLRDMIP